MVSAVFGGLALGAWLGDRPAARSSTPGRLYALLEVVIGLWAVATTFLVPRANDLAAAWIGFEPSPVAHWSVAFSLPFLTLLPATAAMGATLPAIERLTARLEADGRRVAGLYALNTFGAGLGIVASHFLLVPELGLERTVLVLAAANLACAGLVGLGAARGERSRPPVAATMSDVPSRAVLLLAAFATGLLGIGYELLGVRVMGQVLESTVFSFAAALVAYLVGSAAGATLYQRLASKREFLGTFERLLILQVIACGLGIVVVGASSEVYAALRGMLGIGLVGSVLSELGLAACVFVLPAGVMGATFSHLMQAARQAGGGIGAVFATNTAGAALSSLVFGLTLLPTVGATGALVILSTGYLLLLPRRSLGRLSLGATGFGLLYLYVGPLWMIDAGEGRVVHLAEGRLASVAVVDLGEGGRHLKVNDRFRMGGTGPGEFGARRLAHLPLLLHREPHKALFLGVGTGVTLAAADFHPELETVGVELMPEVVAAMPWFSAGNQALLDSTDVRVVTGDARRCVRAYPGLADVIVADLFHPGRDGAGSLYTVEHFEAVRDRLAPGGLFCQWLPLHQMDEDVLRVLVRTYLEVFPHTQAFIGQFNLSTPALALVGTLESSDFGPDLYPELEGRPRFASELTRAGFRDAYQLLGTWLASGSTLRGWVGEGPLNTDDRPFVEYAAPSLAYEADDVEGLHAELLLDLSEQDPLSLMGEAAGASDFRSSLAEYLVARDLYLEASLASLEGDREGARELLQESAAASSRFRTAYELLLVEARGLARARTTEARQLLERLERDVPEREDARILRERLFRNG